MEARRKHPRRRLKSSKTSACLAEAAPAWSLLSWTSRRKGLYVAFPSRYFVATQEFGRFRGQSRHEPRNGTLAVTLDLVTSTGASEESIQLAGVAGSFTATTVRSTA